MPNSQELLRQILISEVGEERVALGGVAAVLEVEQHPVHLGQSGIRKGKENATYLVSAKKKMAQI